MFRVRCPIVAHELADPEKGTGVAQICTFGDVTDVVWWRELGLPTRVVVRRDGTLIEGRFGEPGWESLDPEAANAAMAELTGKAAKQARTRIVELLRDGGWLLGEPEPVRHAVKFYEYGTRPLEVVSSRQWFVRMLEQREALLARGREMRWHPALHGRALRVVGRRAEPGLGAQPAAVLRGAVPGVVPARRRGRPGYEDPILPDEATPADRPAGGRAAGLHGRAARRAGRVRRATPTSWTPGPRRH